ncbi:MAG: hypothetical protein V1721_04975 [Pseudomonadota bacterium]
MDSKFSVKKLVVYHDCIDGAASAWAFRQKWGDDPKTDYVSYSHDKAAESEEKILSTLESGTLLYFADVAPTPAFLEILLSPASGLAAVAIIDHHKSAAGNLQGYIPSVFEGFAPPRLDIRIEKDNPSASGMVWRELFPDRTPPDFLKMIEKMDRSGLASREDYAAAALIDSKPIRSPEEAFKTCDALSLMTYDEMVREGEPIFTDQERRIAKLADAVMYAKFEPFPGSPPFLVPVINANVRDFGRYITKFLQDLGEEAGSGVAFAWHETKEGSVVMSIRSLDGLDTSTVAKYFCSEKEGITGGGHGNMAAVTFPSYEVFEKKVLKNVVEKGSVPAPRAKKPPAQSL